MPAVVDASPSQTGAPAGAAPRRANLAAALAQLAELGPPTELVALAPETAAHAVGMHRVVLSRVEGSALLVESAFVRDDADGGAELVRLLRDVPLSLAYPVAEGEVMRRRRAQVLGGGHRGAPRRRHAFTDALGWPSYVAAPIVLDGRVIGFFHADRPCSRPALDAGHAEALGDFALCFAIVFERSILRRRLRIQRDEMRRVAAWADARSGDISGRAIALSREDAEPGGSADATPTPERLRDLFTRREIEVVQLMVQGQTNAAIARELVLSEGTVKFHVKNILRKLDATNRAEAASRYLRITLARPDAASG